jgi:hypothetical protein
VLAFPPKLENMAKIREILLTQYIGAVMIGLILAQGVSALVNGITQSGLEYWVAQHSRAVFASAPEFSWRGLLISAIRVLLYLMISLALIRWLYVGSDNETDDSTAEGAREI